MSFEDDEYWDAEYSDQAVGYADNTAIAHDRYAYVDRPVPSRRNGSGGRDEWADDADGEAAYDELAVRRQRRQRNNAQSASREQRIRAAFDAERPSWLDDPAFAARGGQRTGDQDRDRDRRAPAGPGWNTDTADWDEQGDDWDAADDEWDAPAADWDEPRDRQPRRRATGADGAGWEPDDDGPIRRPGGRRTGGGPGAYDGVPSRPADRPASGRARVPEQPVSDAPLDLYRPPSRRNDSGRGEDDGRRRADVPSGDPRSGDGAARAAAWADDDIAWADDAAWRDGRARRDDSAAWADEPGRHPAPGRDGSRRSDATPRPVGWADNSQRAVGWAGDDGHGTDRLDSDRRASGRPGRADRETGWTGQADRKPGWAEQVDRKPGWTEQVDRKPGWTDPADRQTGWGREQDDRQTGWDSEQSDRQTGWDSEQDDRETGWDSERSGRETGWADRSERDRRGTERRGTGWRDASQPRRDRPDSRTWPDDDLPAARGHASVDGADARSGRGTAGDRRDGPPAGDRRDDVLHGELLPPDPRRHRPQPGAPAGGPGTTPEQYGAPFPAPGLPGWTGGPFPGPGFPGWTGPGFPGPWGPGSAGPGWDGPPWERQGHGAPGWAESGRPGEFAQRDATPLADRPAAVEPDEDEDWSPSPAARGGAAVEDTRRDRTDDAETWDDRAPYSGRWDEERAFRHEQGTNPDRYDERGGREYDEPLDPAAREYGQPLDPAARVRRERGDEDARGDERRAESGPADTGPRVLSKANPPTAPRVISKATPPPAPRVIKKAEPPAMPRVVGTTPQVGPARVIPPAPPTVQPGMSPAATTDPSGTGPVAAPTSPAAMPAATVAPAGTSAPVSPAQASAPPRSPMSPAPAPPAQAPASSAHAPASSGQTPATPAQAPGSSDPRRASGVPGGTSAPRVRPPVPPPSATPAAGPSVPGVPRSATAPPAAAPRAVPPPAVPAPAPAPPAVPPTPVPAAAAPLPVAPGAAAPPRAVPPGPATGSTAPAPQPAAAGGGPAHPAPTRTPPPPGGRPSAQTAGDGPLKPIARLATSGPDTAPRQYADAGLSGGWFTPHADAPPPGPDAGGAPATVTADAASGADRAPGMVVDLDITDMLTNLATGQQPVVVPHPTLPADEEPEDAAGNTTAERPEPSVMSRPEPVEPKTPVRPLKPLSAEDLAAIRWRLDGGTLREVVDDRDALRELGVRLDEPLAGEADHATRAGLLSVRAEVYRLLDELGMAAAASRLALSHAESSGDVQAIVIAQAELAHVLRLRGDHAEADRLFEVAASSEAPPVLRSVVHENAGRSCFDQGRHMEALDHFARAIRLGDPEDLDLVERVDVSLEAVYIHVLRDGWGPYPRLRREILGEPAERPAATAATG